MGWIETEIRALLAVVAVLSASCCGELRADDHPLSADLRAKIDAHCDLAIVQATEQINAEPGNVRLYSERGDAHFFRAQFEQAVVDYEKMIELESELETRHWRLGIAYFYAGRYAKAAAQFALFHTFDDVDRENGIWRYFSHVKSKGREAARRELLKYEKDDREPFPDVYRLFSGDIEPGQIVRQIRLAEIDEPERQKRLFYAHLYIGLNHAVQERPELSIRHLRLAVANEWPRDAGFGPRYMWHVGRLHYEKLAAAANR